MIDKNAPIIPWQGMGGIKLYSTIKEMREILEDSAVKGTLLNNLWARYEISNTLYLFVHLVNGKLFKITTLEKYTGKLFENICVGMTEKELLETDPTFVYDDFEEVFESDKGVFLETDPETSKITEISVYIKELDDDDFEEGEW